jgi:hypothetical protein
MGIQPYPLSFPLHFPTKKIKLWLAKNTRSSALPFIQRGQYYHAKGRTKEEPYSYQDIATVKYLHMYTYLWRIVNSPVLIIYTLNVKSLKISGEWPCIWNFRTTVLTGQSETQGVPDSPYYGCWYGNKTKIRVSTVYCMSSKHIS